MVVVLSAGKVLRADVCTGRGGKLCMNSKKLITGIDLVCSIDLAMKLAFETGICRVRHWCCKHPQWMGRIHSGSRHKWMPQQNTKKGLA